MSDEHTSAKGPHKTESSGSTPRRWAGQRKPRNSPSGYASTFGALDLGTNNCRLLIAKQTGETYRIIDSFSRVVRLGAGLSSSGKLSEKSMDAAVGAIEICASKMKAKNVARWRCIATQACRQARNGDEFLARVKSETGITLELISPRVEARLAVMGCLTLIDKTKDVAMVFDIGGGSSELSWVDIRRIRAGEGTDRVHRPPISAWASLPAGVVTLSEAIPGDNETPEGLTARYEAMKAHVRGLIAKAGCENRFTNTFAEGRGHLIGTSGTITSLAGIHLDLPYYQRDKVDGLWMDGSDVTALSRKMAAMTVNQRADIPCIGYDRASLLIAGCAIMDVLLEMWPAQRVRVADRGLREGMLMGLIASHNKRQNKGNHNGKG
ncbi:Ppx/GppA phosphatase family protein [Robiginitomaculum antarcticum]|uniref:Ppx/GppA phosphatase family protein n=1 Tax=Robiginitomaculum antarcticum TaxID=437507 RepID=UPI0003707934|nr:Ppx/GppA phosphatase family protein [Robiginitomaculum antarcticum]